MKCLWCREEIEFRQTWQHVSDGTLLRTRTDEQGVERDDHYAQPGYEIAR